MTAAPRYSCVRCGKRAVAEKMTYSRFTGRRYCHDTTACERRKAKLERQGAVYERGFLELL